MIGSDLASEDASKLQRLLAAVDLIADIDKDMPMQMVRALILVCLEEGLGPNELARKAGVSSAVMSRHISDLGEVNRYKQEGLHLVTQKTDIMDRRYRKVFLSPKGIAFRNRLLRALGR